MLDVARRVFCPSVCSMPCIAVVNDGFRVEKEAIFVLLHFLRLENIVPRSTFSFPHTNLTLSFFLIFNFRDLTLEIDNVSNIFFSV